ncbi:MAG: cell surface protein SprA [Saprospiraceae bacterium]|nr:cell surface protein SprA [Saprospiraceae bacterium]
MIFQNRVFIIVSVIIFYGVSLIGGGKQLPDPFVIEKQTIVDTIPYKNRPGTDPEKDKKNPFDLKDPKSVDKEIEYDPVTGEYIIREKIGSDYYSNPSSLSFEEYMAFKARQQDRDYLKDKTGVSKKRSRFSQAVDPLKKIDLKKNLSDRLFGGAGIQIEPRGNVDLFVGGFYNFNDNPQLTSRQKYQYGPDFDMDIQMELQASIGDKLKLNTNYNTQSSFDFDTRLKLAYDSEKFTEDDIIKKIEAGNVALPLRSTLIKGSQNLFGFKTDWQFGHLKLSGLIAQQNSRNENISSKGGGIVNEYEIRPDQYDENRHFFLSHFNRDKYEASLDLLPEVQSSFRIKDIEVWMSDDGTNSRDLNVKTILAFSEIGTPPNDPKDMFESTFQQFLPTGPIPVTLKGSNRDSIPCNESNRMFEIFSRDSLVRNQNTAVDRLTNHYGLIQGKDFQRVQARRLNSSEFTFNAELGFISLRTRPKPDQIVAVSYHFLYNGHDKDPKTNIPFKIGEVSSDVGSDSVNFNLTFVKLLKSSNQVTTLNSYDLMMKNVYPIGGFNLGQDGFTFDIFYESPKGIQQRFIDDPNPKLDGYPLLNLFRLDNLNRTNDPQPDGVFDWIPGQTVIPNSGAVIFPVLEPFGTGLKKLIKKALPLAPDNEIEDIYKKYQYEFLYDSSITKARQNLSSNQFLMKGTSKSGKSNEIPLNTFGGTDPNAKIIVRAGSLVLTENVDYVVDRNQGKVTILNESLLNGNNNITVDYENNSLFSLQRRAMIGFRAEYSKSKDFYIGSTFMNLFERPITQKVNLGEDPINNKVYGLDFGYSKSTPWLTRALDALPIYSTKEASKISIQAEAAYLDPGYSRAIEQTGSEGGVVYIDDFEGAATGIGLYFNPNQWILASVPTSKSLGDQFLGNNVLKNLYTSSNRALLSWYRIDPVARNGAPDANNSYTRLVDETEIFPNRQRQIGFSQELTFDLTYYPREKGPYNYDVMGGIAGNDGQKTSGIDANNKLNDPRTRWGGIMTKLNTNDFEIANVEYIDFWLLDPYLPKHDGSTVSVDSGRLILQLGTFSEDILKDGIAQFENGLPTTNTKLPTLITPFGKITAKAPIINTFDNNEREQQDIGLDGLKSRNASGQNDLTEQEHFQDYLTKLRSLNQNAYTLVELDPSNDDYKSYRATDFPTNATVLEKYKRNNMLEGNSQIEQGNQISTASTGQPDQEDLNFDRSLNELENYYSYTVDLSTSGGKIVSPFITETIVTRNNENWYRFRIPIANWSHKEGTLSDFRSIQSMRMLVTNFSESVTLRFIKLQLGRNNWRRQDSRCPGDATNDLILDKVDIEENKSRKPFGYETPPGIQRQQIFGSGTTANLLANEAAILMRKTNFLPQCTTTITRIAELDIRRYERFKMFVHAEDANQGINSSDLKVFVRLGRDFTNNYYEYEIPIQMIGKTVDTAGIKPGEIVWLKENEFDFPLSLLIDLKNKRNIDGIPFTTEYSIPDPDKMQNLVKIIGNPNLAGVRGIMIGMKNSSSNTIVSAEIWVNEMRLTGIENRGGFAALARGEIQLADLGNISVAGAYTSLGYGGIDQRLNDRSLDEIKQLDATTSLDLGKFLPKSASISLPFTAQYSVAESRPEYDANDRDVKLKDKLDQALSGQARDSILEKSIDYTTVRGFAFNNVRKNRTGSKKPMPWNIENFAMSYGQSVSLKHNPIVLQDKLETRKGALDYNFGLNVKYIEPFKFIKSKYLKFLSEFNFNPIPNSIAIRNNLDRKQAVTIYRFASPNYASWETIKFGWLRDYTLNWDLTKSIKFNYNAQVDAVVDEITFNPLEGGHVNPLTGRIVDESEKKPFARENLRNFGRIRDFKHNVSLSYNLPTRLIPGFEWITSRAQYNSNYGWASGSQRTIDSLGSVISNGNTISLNGEFNFLNLYNKIPYLKRINDESDNSGRRSQVKKPKTKTKTDQEGAKEKKQNSGERKITMFEKIALRPLMMVRRIQLNYTENNATVVPGFTERPELLGMNKGFTAPGWGFIAGIKPNLGEGGFLDQAADKDWITKNLCLNREVIQRNTKTIGAKGRIEVFKNFNIDLNLDKTHTNDYSETFKYDELINTNPGQYGFQHLSPYYTGTYTVSYISTKTLFKKDIDALFSKFSENREIVSSRLGDRYGITNPSTGNSEYREGFTGFHQDVILGSFISTYRDADPKTSNIDVFKVAPMPNWQLNYSGLTKLGGMKNVFQDFSIRHAYKNTFTVSSFRTNLDYEENSFGVPTRLRSSDTLSYYTKLEIPTVTVNESFSPLIGINMKTKSGFDLSLDYSKSRQLSMNSSLNGQLTETKATTYTIKTGYIVKNVYLNFLPGAKKIKKPKKPKKGQTQEEVNAKLPKGNDLQFTCDFSLRDDISKVHNLDVGQQVAAQISNGAHVIMISPAVKYNINKNLNVRMHVDYNRRVPYVSTSFKDVRINGGLTVQFLLN